LQAARLKGFPSISSCAAQSIQKGRIAFSHRTIMTDRRCVSCESLIKEIKRLHDENDDLRERLYDKQVELDWEWERD